MRATGIVRRIDELGRVVIPKEIRKTMRIRRGAPLEIFTNGDGDVIFRKYSLVSGLGSCAERYADSLAELLGRPVAVCDTDAVLAAAPSKKKELAGLAISDALEEAMSRKGAKASDKEIELCNGATAAAASFVVSGGDVIGCIAILDDGGEIKKEDRHALNVAARLLAGQAGG